MRKVLTAILLFIGLNTFGQLHVPFESRPSETSIKVKGNYTFLSNSILNRYDRDNNANVSYNGEDNNNDLHRDYIDIDADASTFSSSAAELSLPDCSRVVYAGLYWAGNYNGEVSNNSMIPGIPRNDATRNAVNAIKLKIPGSSTYVDVVADNNPDPEGKEDHIVIDDPNLQNAPYVCYANVTDQIQSLASANGTYTVANVRGTRGQSVGGAAGWTIVIVYENDAETNKNITFFDGYAAIQTNQAPVDLTVSGFKTIDNGPVSAKFGVAAIEGDRSFSGDKFLFATQNYPQYAELGNTLNPNTNFFKSNITENDQIAQGLFPSSENTLGYDSDLFDLENSNNSVMANGEEEAYIRLETLNDTYSAFLVAFGVEVIDPQVDLLQNIVYNNSVFEDLSIAKGEAFQIQHKLSNTGNDEVATMSISGIVPQQFEFLESEVSLPSGVNYTYDSTSRLLSLTFDANTISNQELVYTIPFKITDNCSGLMGPCGNLVDFQMNTSYAGVVNPALKESISSTDISNCSLPNYAANNFTINGLEDCDSPTSVNLCDGNTELVAAEGYSDYTWRFDQNQNGTLDTSDPIVSSGTNSFITTYTGLFFVEQISDNPDCSNSILSFDVGQSGFIQNNPLIPYINGDIANYNGTIFECEDTNEEIPIFYLCDDGSSYDFNLNLNGVVDYSWEKLDPNCENKDLCTLHNNSCEWQTVTNSANYTVSEGGLYRINLTQEDGCTTNYFFRVDQLDYNPEVLVENHMCTTLGSIEIANLSDQFRFRLIDPITYQIIRDFQDSPVFDGLAEGVYSVEIESNLEGNACIYYIDLIEIEEIETEEIFSYNQISCDELGSASVELRNVIGQNTFTFYEESDLISETTTEETDWSVAGLTAGTYRVVAENEYGCVWSHNFTIKEYEQMTFNGFDVTEIGCQEAELNIDIQGGVAPFSFALMASNGQVFYNDVSAIDDNAFNNSPEAIADRNTNNTYTYAIKDAKGCIIVLPEIVVEDQELFDYSLTTENLLCDGTVDGSVNLTINELDGYQASFNLSGGAYNSTNDTGLFEALEPGSYVLEITKTKEGQSCVVNETIIIEPAPVVQFDHQQISCEDLASVNFTSEDTTAVFGYDIFLNGSLVDTQTNLANQITVDGLQAGDYNIVVYNDQNCSWEYPFNITDYQEMTFNGFDVTEIGCQEAELNIDIQGGVAPFSFALMASNGQVFYNDVSAIDDNAFNNSPEAIADRNTNNTYTYAIKDAKGCIIVLPEIVVEDQELFDYSLTTENLLCDGTVDGSVNLTINELDGYQASFNLSGGAYNSTNDTGLFEALEPGSYVLEITKTKEGQSCVVNETIIIEPAPVVQFDHQQISCEDLASVNFTSEDTTAVFGYDIFLNGSLVDTQTNLANQITVDGLQAGDYNIVVYNDQNCSWEYPFNITDYQEMTFNGFDVTEIGCQEAELNIDIQGGVAPFSFALMASNGQVFYNDVSAIDDNAFNNSPEAIADRNTNNTYTYAIKDAKGCIIVLPEIVVEDQELFDYSLTTENLLCDGTVDGSVNLTINELDGYQASFNLSGGAYNSTNDTGLFEALEPGSYVLEITKTKEGQSCVVNETIIIEPAPVVQFDHQQISCEDLASVNFTSEDTTAVFGYDIFLNGSLVDTQTNLANQITVDGLQAGDYNIVVYNDQNCSWEYPFNITDYQEMTFNGFDVTEIGCQEAELNIDIQGGVAPFSFALMASNGQVFYNDVSAIDDNAFNNSPEAIADRNTNNTYTYAIKDAKGCIIVLPEIVVEDQELFDYSLTTENLLCDGTVDGSVNLTINELDGYQASFNLSGGAYNSTNDTGLFEALEPGSYVLEITKTKEGQSCVVNETIIIEPAPVVQFDHQQISCEDLASVNFTSEDTTAVFGYDIFLNGSLVDTQTNLANQITVDGLQAGDYNIVVYNDQNCSWEYPFNITDYQEMTFNGFDVTEIGCQEAELNIDIQGGVAPFSFALMASNGQVFYNDVSAIDDNAFNNSPEAIADRNTNNTYTYAIKDAKGCIIVLPEIVVEDQELFDYSITVQDAGCYGESNGVISIDVIEADGYQASFNLSGGAYNSTNDTGLFEALEPGSYVLEITKTKEGQSCVVNETLEIVQPSAEIVSSFNVGIFSCESGADLEVTSEGGAAPYQYELWFNGELIGQNDQNGVFNDLSTPGEYTIITTDSNGCDSTDTFKIEQPEQVEYSLSVSQQLSCTDAALISLNILQAGTFTAQLIDENGLIAEERNGVPDGSLTFEVAAFGSYNVIIKDDISGCITESSVISILEPTSPIIDFNASEDYLCDNTSTTSLSLVASNYEGDYTVDVFKNGQFWRNVNASEIENGSIQNVEAGEYYAVFTELDFPFCSETTGSVTIDAPSIPLSIENIEVSSASCSYMNDGTVQVSATGGTGAITYTITEVNQSNTTGVFENITSGVFNLVVTDEKGCVDQTSFEIEAPEELLLNFDDLTSESCLGNNDGSAIFSISGGSGMYDVFVNNELVSAPYEFDSLTPGVYDVEVIDSTGCNLNGSFEITRGVTLSATVAPIYLCGENNVFNAIDIIVEGADQNLVFALDSNDPAEAREENYFENLSPGEHFISVIHPNGCAEIVSFEIDYFEPLSLSVDLSTPNQATTVVTGGEGPYEIFINEDYDNPISSEDGSFDYPITYSGIESFSVMDAKGCVQTVSAELTFYDIEIPKYFTPNNDGIDDTWKVTNSFAYGDIDVRVFDRYGRLLISMNANQVWDGTYKGAPLPNGDYWYVIRLNSASNPLEKMGHFTLYR